MILKDFLPNPALSEFVQWYRIVHFEYDKTAPFPFKAYPPKPEECLHFFIRDNELVELISSTKKDYQLPVVLTGQQTSVMYRYPGRNLISFQIVFQPTALFRLTGIPSFELTNHYIDAEYIFSNKIQLIHEQLQNAKGYSEMLIVADKFVMNLISHVRRGIHPLDIASKLMMRLGGNISMDWLAKESCLCIKQFERKFNERAGINPKTYAKIVRFTKAFNTKNRHPTMDWLRVAVECEYFDYQHLVKDYKEFTCMTPNEFHLLESNSPEAVLGLTNDLYPTRM